ncbi:MAG: CBS domain-containing protein [Nitrospinae bacterium]|nr:CBS domain-containing protein [Nitrospinota bacterium]
MQVITTHVNADFDCLASMVAAQKLYPGARMVFPGSMEKASQEYLKRFNHPFQFARIKDVDLQAVDLLVVVDTQDPGRIGVFSALLGKPGVEVHVYDHHLDVAVKIPAHKAEIRKRGSSATVLFEVLSLRNIALSPEEATLLALGIYQDTHLLVSPMAVPEDFLAVGALLKMGADLNVVSDFVHPRLNQEQVSVMNDLIRNLETLNINGVEIAIATAIVERYVGDLSIVAQKMVELENLPVLFLLVSLDRRVYLIARSRAEEINVAEIAQAFEGGGHPSAASASVKDMTLVQAREKLLSVLAEKVQPLALARDIMHSPAVSVREKDSVGKVEKILTRFNLNTLPVVSGKKPVGLITRQIVEKAIHHKLEKEPTSDFMIREFSVTYPESYFKTVIPVIIEEKQKLAPVVDPGDGRLIGIISRGDLLRALSGDMAKYAGTDSVSIFDGKDRPLKNVKSVMKERLPKEIMALFDEVAATADRTGVSVYVVGGFVRDLLLRIENLDIDVVVEGDGIKFAKALARRLGGRTRSHAKFGTSVVVLDSGFKIDVATARMEFYKHPAALPTVESSSIKSDLFRRDFTFNSLAIKLNGKDRYGIIDFFNGQRDLKEKTVRVLHNLSFIEDPSRAFRAIRFEQRFQFAIGKQTESFLKHAVKKRLVDQLSGSRLLNELILILKEKKPLRCILRMKELDLLKFVHPGILKERESLETLQRVEEVLSWSKMASLPRSPDVWHIYLMGLAYSLPASAFAQAVERLNMPMKLRVRLKSDCEGCAEALRRLKRKQDRSPSEIYGIFSGLSEEAILFMLAVSESERINRDALLYFTQYGPCAKPSLTGDDLIRLGIKPGPIFKTVFKVLRDARVNGRVRTREEEIGLVRKDFLNR